jgi:hypothetical protein
MISRQALRLGGLSPSPGKPWWAGPRLVGLTCLALTVYVVVCCRVWLSAAATSATARLGLGGRLRAMAAGEEDEEAQHARVRAELGRGTWQMLHRMMAKFPKAPTVEQREQLHAFVHAFSHLYPCDQCAHHFRDMLADSPVEDHSASNAAVSLWLCALHNRVNQRLNKPAFPCTLEALGERWGECGCFGNATDATPLSAPLLSPGSQQAPLQADQVPEAGLARSRRG